MSNQVMLNGMVDSRGLTRDLDTKEMDLLADQIGMVREIVDLAAGDLINQKAKALGIRVSSRQPDAEKSEFFKLEQFVVSMGYTMGTAAEYATVARKFPRADRVAGLGFFHYKALQGMENRGKAVEILKEAQMGYRKPNGKWVKPHTVKWVKDKRKAVEGNSNQIAKVVKDKTVHDTTQQALPSIRKVLENAKVPKRTIEATVRKVQTGIEEANAELAESFDLAVHKAAVDSSRKMLDRAKKAEAEAKAEKERLSDLWDGVHRPLLESEFKYLRQFCHPDRHPGNEEKARKALDIVTRIGERLHFTNTR